MSDEHRELPHERLSHTCLLFVDEIHRFKRAQQDSFLPYVEDGTVPLIGATTENPSFEFLRRAWSPCCPAPRMA
ncbi:MULTISPECIES: hypothetical protein [unclassified Streptomyces]|uniref:hypothetical protein n=1 Tax=unclassified Streptomyces TaxID=2593676 RepID=UPI0015CF32D4|nr:MULTISPECIES: hypothetical protein [unclassified Streptomyces]